MDDVGFRPVDGRLLILPKQEDSTTTSGILIAEQKEKPDIGTVVVGSRAYPAGCKVLFSKFGFDEVLLSGKKHYVVSEACVLGYFTA